MLRRNRQKGFTLIELLIVVAIIGIIAAILIPNLIDALQKAKQKRTVSDLRNVGTSIMSWLTDQISAAAAGGQPYDASTFTTRAYKDVLEMMNSKDNPAFFYMQEVPELDGWKNPYEWFFHSNLLNANVYIMCSPGRNGAFENPNACNASHASADTGPFVATDYDHDIKFADGYFIMHPGSVKP